jgi:nucleoside 2-deoxyribosyltransferase
MTKMIYVSGPVTKNKNATEQFEEADKFLRKRGHIPLNPIRIDAPHPLKMGKWLYYMRKSVELLMKSDALFLLDGWEKSDGARIEFDLCIKLGIPIYFNCDKEKLDELSRTD